jgi:UPF0716 protein FxsA
MYWLVLLVLPLIDAALLAYLASTWLGWPLAVLIVVLTGLIGLLLVRAEGRRTLGKIQRKLAAGEIPTDDVLDGAMLVAAGAFLLTPGFVSDLIGFLFVVPITRIPIRLALKRWLITPYLDSRTGGFVSGQVYTVGNGWNDGGHQGTTIDIEDDS